jgi:hypothetical protein
MFRPRHGILRDPAGEVNEKKSPRQDTDMHSLSRRTCGWVLAALAVLVCGCARQDRERLATVGSRLSARAEGLLGSSRGRLATAWQTLQTNWESLSLDARVAARLRWDKTLEGAPVRTETSGGVVRLQGAVPDPRQRQRAVDLAATTVGVERVVEEWEAP